MKICKLASIKDDKRCINKFKEKKKKEKEKCQAR